MSKISSPLKAKVMQSLDSLEEQQERNTQPKLNDPPTTALPSGQYALDEEVPTDDNQAEKFVTRNYSFIASIDNDIDRLRMALKQKGRKFTKQELVNVLLQERLQQLIDKKIF